MSESSVPAAGGGGEAALAVQSTAAAATQSVTVVSAPQQLQQQQMQQQQLNQQQLQQLQPIQMQQQHLQPSGQQATGQQIIGSPQAGQMVTQIQGLGGGTSLASSHGLLPTTPTYSTGHMVRAAGIPAFQTAAGQHAHMAGVLPAGAGGGGMQQVQLAGMQGPVQLISQPQFITHQQFQQQQQQQLMLQQAMQQQSQNLQPQMNIVQQQQQQQQQQIPSRPNSNNQQPKSPGNNSSGQAGVKVSIPSSLVTITSRPGGGNTALPKQHMVTSITSQAGTGGGQLLQAAGSKQQPVLRMQGAGGPVVIGQLGMGTMVSGQSLLPAGPQQPKSPAGAGGPGAFSLAAAPQSQLQLQQGGSQHIRFSTQPTFVQTAGGGGGGGQIITSGPTVLNMTQLQAMNFQPAAAMQAGGSSVSQATLLGAGAATPLYIRPATAGQQHIQPSSVLSNVQAVAPSTKPPTTPTSSSPGGSTTGTPRTPTAAAGGNVRLNQPLRGVRPLAPTTTSQPPAVTSPQTSRPPPATAKPGKAKSPAAGTATQVKIAPQPSKPPAGGSAPPTLTVSPKIRQPLQPAASNAQVGVKAPVAPRSGVSTGPVTPAPQQGPRSLPATTASPAPSKATLSGSGGERRQLAVVKPVLTHIIEGFIIQEATTPFPVQRPPMLTDYLGSSSGQKSGDADTAGEKPTQEAEQPPAVTTATEPEKQTAASTGRRKPGRKHTGPKLQCEFCRKSDFASKFGRSKRFCSIACAKRYNEEQVVEAATSSVEMSSADEHEEESSAQPSGESGEEPDDVVMVPVAGDAAAVAGLPSSPQSPPQLEREVPPPPEQEPVVPPRKHPKDWNVEEVYNFLNTLPGCTMYAAEFLAQEIDGQALMLLKEDHLMTAMSMKLGPALKMLAKINALKEERS